MKVIEGARGSGAARRAIGRLNSQFLGCPFGYGATRFLPPLTCEQCSFAIFLLLWPCRGEVLNWLPGMRVITCNAGPLAAAYDAPPAVHCNRRLCNIARHAHRSGVQIETGRHFKEMNRHIQSIGHFERSVEDSRLRRALAARLDKAFKRSGVSSAQVARRLNLSEADVQYWRQGITVPPLNVCARLADILSLDVHWLCTGQPQDTRSASSAPAR
ncbi:helix-turn-helix domain-containing protein [Paraburkholderia fungorum]|jgi:ribosome-binding protein aMBF1 (putative translation factor)|uniref:helix-turn-helix domain-containing protein n=1 Tax=Paraburkholderia fungorum TaxID=134537 RepID=UPI00241CE052|nr:helix-turn-helix transcriptional regulator [Paraburkholderia fungorum]